MYVSSFNSSKTNSFATNLFPLNRIRGTILGGKCMQIHWLSPSYSLRRLYIRPSMPSSINCESANQEEESFVRARALARAKGNKEQKSESRRNLLFRFLDTSTQQKYGWLDGWMVGWSEGLFPRKFFSIFLFLLSQETCWRLYKREQ